MNKVTILIVEDEAIVAEDLAVTIQQLGYHVAGLTATGEEAIELARQQRPALVLMDIRLAGSMDGVTAAQMIRCECNLPILFLTANYDADTVKAAQQTGALGYILKPFDERDLRIQIEMVLYKHAAEQRLQEREERLTAINQILHAALLYETEEELGRACLDIAKKITLSRSGFIGDINKTGLEDIAISNPGWENCNFIEPQGHRKQPGGFKIHGLYGRVVLDGKSFFTNDPANHPDSIGLPEKHPPLKSFLGAPLMLNGSVIGLIAVANREGGYTKTEQESLEAIAPSIVEALLRKRAEKALTVLNQELEQRVEHRTRELQESQKQCLHAEKLSAIGKLSASIAHEFNNPLQGILPILQGFKKWKELAGKDGEMLDLAISECNRMKNLIRSLQDFNRPSSGEKTLVDVHWTIDSLLLLCKSDFRRKEITQVKNYAERLPQIKVVPDQIKQVFLNLLTNAADACIRNERVITISTWQEEQRVAIAIQDTGVGIQPENIDQIFRPFYTTKPEVKGTGLGLSISHGIVQNHQGEIRVVSHPGEGSTFTVLLPIQV